MEVVRTVLLINHNIIMFEVEGGRYFFQHKGIPMIGVPPSLKEIDKDAFESMIEEDNGYGVKTSE